MLPIQEKVAIEEAKVNIKVQEADLIRKDCDTELSKVLPIKEKAEKDLLTLTDKDMILLKSMKRPPPPVRLVMEAVCIITKTPYERIPDPQDNSRRINSYWGPSIKLVGKSHFLQILLELNIDDIEEKIF